MVDQLTNVADTLFDLVLGLGVLLTAAGVMLSRDLFRAVVLFIAFGLLVALVWVRLNAPDLALAEAAIGAGITGVLLLDTMGHLRSEHCRADARPIWWPAAVAISLTSIVLLALWLKPVASDLLITLVDDNLTASGVAHPITAVLLNFRSYDTLLEIAVLLVAITVSLSLRRKATDIDGTTARMRAHRDPLLRALMNRLLPIILMVGIYVLWAGSYQTGGAFQAGAILAAAAIFMRLAGYELVRDESTWLRTGLVLGFFVFLLVAAVTMLGGEALLAYPAGYAGDIILLIETALTFSIALILFGLFTHAEDNR